MRSAPIPASLIKSAKNAWRVCVHWWPRVHRREEKRPDKKIYVREIGRSRRRGHVRNIVIVIIIYTYIGDLYEITRRGRTGRDKIYIVCVRLVRLRCRLLVGCQCARGGRSQDFIFFNCFQKFSSAI